MNLYHHISNACHTLFVNGAIHSLITFRCILRFTRGSGTKFHSLLWLHESLSPLLAAHLMTTMLTKAAEVFHVGTIIITNLRIDSSNATTTSLRNVADLQLHLKSDGLHEHRRTGLLYVIILRRLAFEGWVGSVTGEERVAALMTDKGKTVQTGLLHGQTFCLWRRQTLLNWWVEGWKSPHIIHRD